jgi:hypothetical protein
MKSIQERRIIFAAMGHRMAANRQMILGCQLVGQCPTHQPRTQKNGKRLQIGTQDWP